MPSLPTKKLSATEEKRLSRWLCSGKPEGTLNLNQLKGFLFCICTTPVLPQPPVWLPAIFAGDLSFLDGDDQDTGLPLILQLYNHINQTVLKGKAALPGNCVLNREDIGSNFLPGSDLHDWSYGFDTGLQLTLEYWDELPLPDKNLEEEVNYCWVTLSFFANEQLSRERLGKKFKTAKSFLNLLQEIYENLPGIVQSYGHLTRSLPMPPMNDLDQSEPPGFFDQSTAEASSLELIEAAYSTDDPDIATSLATLALDKDPDCIDAFVILAESDAYNIRERIHFLEQAIHRGEASFGKKFFKENAGFFWGLIETRPYMRALQFLADTYREAGRSNDAIAAYEKCLELNENDNLGIRHTLIGVYIEQQQMDKAAALLDTFAEDSSAFMRYSRSLLSYILNGDSDESRRLKEAAKTYNEYVPALLSGKEKMPEELPEYFGYGDKNEAVIYVEEHQRVWRAVMGAIAWLNK